GGTATSALTFSTAAAPVADATAQATRASLVTQYNNVLAQITTTAQDASFNGVNLLNGDQLKLTFNEPDKPTLNVSTALRSEASALGSNLSIVQIRQDFSKNLINVLQTGSSNLTLADTNAEAAKNQALSTPPPTPGAALWLANPSD